MSRGGIQHDWIVYNGVVLPVALAYDRWMKSFGWSANVALAIASVVALGCGEVKMKSGPTDAPMIDGTSDDSSDASMNDAPLDAAPEFSSCVGLDATCGAASNDDCCATAMAIPGGTFYRSYDLATDSFYKDMNSPATISSFRLDKYEVTVGRFRKFVNAGYGTQAKPPAAGAGAHPNLTGSGWDSAWNQDLAPDTSSLVGGLKCDATYQSWTDSVGANENLPINCITWFEAMAFCIWDGGYLPTEAEWDYAAAGGLEQRAYPWSSPAGSLSLDCSYANYNPGGTGQPCASGVNRVGSESSKGDGRWGHSDLAGNVSEWTLDSYAPYVTPCSDCATLIGGNRAVRGGSIAVDVSFLKNYLRVAERLTGSAPSNRTHLTGVRCARLP